MHTLGINIGSSNVKAVMFDGNALLWSDVIPHEGNFLETLRRMLSAREMPEGVLTLATGTEGRYLLNVATVIEPLCVEAALRDIDENVDAVVSLGGEDLIVYTINDEKRIITSFSGNKCASGTGEFFKQQLGRMDMGLDAVDRIGPECRAYKLSTRCSVFMKSDCTHRLNKGEATKDDIVLSLSNVMAIKVADFLKRARMERGRVMLTGGVTRNPYVVAYLSEKLPDMEFVVPGTAPFFEAYGAALLARETGSVLPPADRLVRTHNVQFARFTSLKSAQGRVTFVPSRKTKVRAGREYILGVDGGSTTTKACLIDIETDEITASYYGRTHGDPVKALKQCIEEIRDRYERTSATR